MLETLKSSECFYRNNLGDVPIGNQQITVAELSWLAGIWDGEGTFSIVHATKSGRGTRQLHAKATMENTDPLIINKTCEVLDALSIPYYMSHRAKRTKKHKDAWVVQMVRLAAVLKFCDMVMPYMIAKTERAKIISEFCIDRLSAMPHGLHSGKKVPYSDKAFKLADKLSILNKTGKTDISTTIREKLARQKAEKIHGPKRAKI